MRRLFRWLRAAAAAALILLAATTAAACARSAYVTDFFWWNGPGRSFGVFTSKGSAHVTVRTWKPTPEHAGGVEQPAWEWFARRPPRDLRAELDKVEGRPQPRLLGVVRSTSNRGANSEDLIFPLWPVPIAAGILGSACAAWAARDRRRRWRVRHGLCPRCGYDLRATPAGGGALLDRCPECGAERGVSERNVRTIPERSEATPSPTRAGRAPRTR